MQTVLLIDSDIIAYRIALRNEKSTAFGKVVSELGDACHDADVAIAELARKLKADRAILCLSDKANFRKEVLPTYKSNRKDVVRPELLKDVLGYMRDEYECNGWPTLEADDVMGIMSTHDHMIEGKKIIVSEDKDMRTIPGYLYAPHRNNLGVIEVSELDADRFLCWQAICGDTTDGYGGARGVGKTSVFADEIIAADREDLWDIVWEAFASKGFNETDAIQQLQVARILRAEDYNIEKQEIKLCLPENLMKGVC